MKENDVVGYAKYKGKATEDGFLDAKKSAQAILGFDHALRYFVNKEEPLLASVKYELPVGVRKGSVEIFIPENIGDLLTQVGTGVLVVKYLYGLADKAAKDGLFQTGPIKDIKTIFKGALKCIQWCIKIKKHIASKVAKETFDPNTNEIIIQVEDSVLAVPVDVYKTYKQLPKDIMSQMASIVSDDISLEVGVEENNGVVKEEISVEYKHLFYYETSDDEVLFPNLQHGDKVELEGVITRNNEKTNTIGLEYCGHILTCEPFNRNLLTFKDKIVSKNENEFFSTVRIIGVVDRTDKDGYTESRRPKIIFDEIIPKPPDVIPYTEQSLFND